MEIIYYSNQSEAENSFETLKKYFNCEIIQKMDNYLINVSLLEKEDLAVLYKKLIELDKITNLCPYIPLTSTENSKSLPASESPLFLGDFIFDTNFLYFYKKYQEFRSSVKYIEQGIKYFNHNNVDGLIINVNKNDGLRNTFNIKWDVENKDIEDYLFNWNWGCDRQRVKEISKRYFGKKRGYSYLYEWESLQYLINPEYKGFYLKEAIEANVNYCNEAEFHDYKQMVAFYNRYI